MNDPIFKSDLQLFWEELFDQEILENAYQHNSILFWQDDLGRWIRFINIDYFKLYDVYDICNEFEIY